MDRREAPESVTRLLRKVNWAFAVALLLTGALGLLSWHNAQRAAEDADWVAHTHEVSTTLELTLRHLLDVETGGRGFALSGEEKFLEPYETGKVAVGQDLHALRVLIVDQDQQLRLNVLAGQAAGRIKTAEELVAIRGNSASAATDLELQHGKKMMDAARLTVAQMEAREKTLLDRRTERLRETAHFTTSVIGLGSVLGVVFLSIAGFAVSREIGISARARAQINTLNAELEQRVVERTAALGESEGRLAGVIQSAMDAILTVDEQQNILMFNSAAEKMFLCPAAEALGQPVTRFIPQRFHAAHAGHIHTFADTGVTNRTMGPRNVLWALRADGQEFQIEASISQVVTGGKKLFTVILRDITERVQAEKIREHLAAVVDSSDDAIISKDLSGTINAWNRGAEKIFGYSAAEAVGKPMLMLFPPDRVNEESEILARIRRGESVEHWETVRVRKDGESIDVSVTISPIREGSGEIVGVSKIARDITERKRAEDALRESEDRFLAMVNGIPQLAWMAEADGNVFWYNQRWYDYTGTTFEQMEGWAWQSVHDPDRLPEVLEGWKGAIEAGQPFDMEFPLRGADGVFREFLTRVRPLKNAAGRVTRWFGTNTDISERKHAEQQLADQAEELSRRALELARSRQSLEKQTRMLKLVLESVGEGLIAADSEGHFLIWNDAAKKLMGRDATDLPSEKWNAHYRVFLPDEITLCPPADLPLVRALRGESVQVELIVEQAEPGSKVWLEVSARPMKDAQGGVCGGVAVLHDITERKKQEMELKESEDRFRLFVEHAPAALAMFDREMRYLRWSRRWQRDYGLEGRDLRGLSHYELFPEIPERWKEIHRRALAGEVLRGEDDRLDRIDGSVQWIRWEARPWSDRTGAIAGIVIFAEEITERKQAEERLTGQANELSRQAEELQRSQQALETQSIMLQSVLDSISEGLVAADETGKFILWNPAATRIVGLGADNIPPEQWSDHYYGTYLPDTVTLFPPEQNPLLRAIRGESSTAEMYVRNSELETGVWIEASASPLRGKDGVARGGVVAFRDITQRKKDEGEIRKLNEELEARVIERTAQMQAANQELDAFTYSVSHDLRAPLRHMSGFSKILSEEYGPILPPEAQRHLQRVQEGTRRMGQLVDDLLNLARLGRRDLSMRVSGLQPVVEAVIAELAPECAGRLIEWKIGDLPSVECDPALIRQVFQNLIGNALKYSRPRSPAVIEIGQIKENGRPVIFVRDNGVGFSMKYADKLFGVFQRLHRAEDFEGTGVGLATAQRIVQKHHGRIWAEAELDKGATFYFTLGSSLASSGNDDLKTRAAAAGEQT